MKQSIITTIMLFMTMVMGMQAAEELFIGGKEVKFDKGQTGIITISGGDIKSGSVTYNYNTKTLVLDNVEITRKGDNKRGIRSSVKNLIVKFYGTNTITTTSAAGLRFEANTTINGYGTLTVNSNETALYAGANATVTIEGNKYGNYDRLTLDLSGQYGIAGENSSNGGSVTVAGLTSITASGTSNALCDLKGFTATSTLGVTLKGNKSKPTVKNLGSAVIHVESPVGAAFQKDKKTICLSGSTSGYTGDIILRPLMINETNFPDPNFRKFLTDYTYGWKGYYTDDELINIEEIVVNTKEIASLKGIEYFTGLTKLECYNNQLKTLDLTKNTALGNLDCHNNQLRILDLSNATSLWTLSCQKNQLNTLNLPECDRMEYLDCSENELKTLDLSGNTKLTALYCNDNLLSTLDASMCGWISQLICNNNQLSTLAISKALNTLNCSDNILKKLEFPDESNLKWLECADNQLKTLDVEKLKKLESLVCDNNNMKTLNLPTNSSLETLDCSYNELTTIDLKNNYKLTELYCNDNQLTALNIQLFGVTTLFCYHNKIRGTQMDEFIRYLPTLKGSGTLRVFYDDAKEENICTKKQVAEIKDINWLVFYYNTAKAKWMEYEGSDQKKLGDADGDGKLTKADVNAIVLHIMGQTSNGFDVKAANVNKDKKIDAADIVALINLIKNTQ